VLNVVAVSEISSFCWLMRFVCSEARVASMRQPRSSGCVTLAVRPEL